MVRIQFKYFKKIDRDKEAKKGIDMSIISHMYYNCPQICCRYGSEDNENEYVHILSEYTDRLQNYLRLRQTRRKPKNGATPPLRQSNWSIERSSSTSKCSATGRNRFEF